MRKFIGLFSILMLLGCEGVNENELKSNGESQSQGESKSERQNGEMSRVSVDSRLMQAQEKVSLGHFDEAMALFKSIEKESQHPLAQFNLALYHDWGWGGEVNRAQACHWYHKAAEGDLPAAAHFFATCLVDGSFKSGDASEDPYALAAYWFKRAADLGHHGSWCSLADLYVDGRGVDKDPKRAVELCLQSAQQGSVPSMLHLTDFLMNETLPIYDPHAARHWLEMASQYGSPIAQYRYAQLLKEGVGGNVDLSAARHYFETAASVGYRDAYLPTARLYLEATVDPVSHLLPPKDLAKSYLWLSAAEQCAKRSEEIERAKVLMKQVKAVMPSEWEKDLNDKVAKHFKQYPLTDG